VSDAERRAFRQMLNGKNMPFGLKTHLALRSISDLLKFFIMYMPGPLGYGLRQGYYNKRLKYMGPNVLIDIGVIIIEPHNISIDAFSWIDSYVRIEGYKDRPDAEIKIGKRVHIAQGSILSGGGGIYIGDYVGISGGCKIYSSTLHYGGGKRMTPMIPIKSKSVIAKPVFIGKDAFLGVNTVVMPGVKIGEGAIIGSCSFVNKDVQPWTIAIGVPAKPIGERPKIIEPDV
jgi:galactoside O-acetyltransferase